MKDFETMLHLTLGISRGIEGIFFELEEVLFSKCDNEKRINKEVTDKFNKLHKQSLEQRELFPELNIIPLHCVILVDIKDAIKFVSKKKYVTEHDKALLLKTNELINKVYKYI